MSITTGKVRASFVHVFQPHAAQGSTDARYSITLLIPKMDAATLNAIYAEIERVKQAGIQKDFGGVLPPVLNIPIYDGDGVRPNGEPFGEECKGHMVLRASSRAQPSVVDLHVQPILNPSEVYSGCYVRASIDFFTYNKSGNRGVGCGLNAVQKIEDGEPLTSRTTAAEAFGGSNAYIGSASSAGNGYSSLSYEGTSHAVVYPAGSSQAVDPINGRPIVPGGVMGI